MIDFLAKDFIETAEGLLFAVVQQGIEQGKVLCFLRYVNGKKLSTNEANSFLKQNHPDYLYYSPFLDARLHAVAIERIIRHHQPRQRLQEIMQAATLDIIERDVFCLATLFQQQGLDLAKTGITGSVLVRFQQQESDIDLVCYDRNIFRQCRALTRHLIVLGQLQELDNDDWYQSWQRRSCALSFAEYLWHEKRKFNKAVINGRKFDLSFIDDSRSIPEPDIYHKLGSIQLRCKVTDDSHSFDYPAEFFIDNPQIKSVVSFTATYIGQAFTGETIEVSGVLEQNKTGLKRIVVGSTREADGEYIKVLSCSE